MTQARRRPDLRRTASALLACLVAWPGLAAAQTAPDLGAMSRQMRDFMVAHMDMLTCEGATKACAPAGPNETPSSLVSDADAEAIVKRGVLDGFAEICGLDWTSRSYLPMMQSWRKLGRADRQVAVMGGLHGLAQGRIVDAKPAPVCPDSMKASIDAQLDFKP